MTQKKGEPAISSSCRTVHAGRVGRVLEDRELWSISERNATCGAVAAAVALDVMSCDFLRMRVRKRAPLSSVALRGFF